MCFLIREIDCVYVDIVCTFLLRVRLCFTNPAFGYQNPVNVMLCYYITRWSEKS